LCRKPSSLTMLVPSRMPLVKERQSVVSQKTQIDEEHAQRTTTSHHDLL
jgi:hypothetical protein